MVDTSPAETVVLPEAATSVVVLGVTGPHPDGGVGILVTEALRGHLPEGVRLLVSSALGSDFAEMDGATHVLVIDCVDVGRRPGTVVLFAGEMLTPCVAQATFRDRWLVHHLVLAGQHADAPEEVALLGVQPATKGIPDPVSAEVGSAIPLMVEQARTVVASWLDPSAPKPPRRDSLPDC